MIALRQSEDICNQIIQQGVDKQAATLYWVMQEDCVHVRLENGQTVFDYQEEKNICLALV